MSNCHKIYRNNICSAVCKYLDSDNVVLALYSSSLYFKLNNEYEVKV